MNKKFFSYTLFKEGFRQTRVIGLVGTIVILALTGFTWLGMLSSVLTQYTMEGVEPFFYACDFEVALVLVLQYVVFCPLMVFSSFGFLNRRDASDVYHALPHSRECLHISYFCAIMVRNLITTLATLVLVLVLYGVSPGMSVSFLGLLAFGFNMLAAQVAVGASVLFAMSITGTRFTNVAVSLLVIFLPRLVIGAFAGMLNNVCVIVDITKQYPFLSPTLNVVAGPPVALFTLNDLENLLNCFTSPVSGIYTLILGCVLFVGALWLLHGRKSETAGKSSPNRVLQGVYRVALGSVAGLIPVAVILSAIVDGDLKDFGFWVIVLVLVFFVALDYFLFELLTTKKAINMVKAIPGFLVVLVLDAVFLGAVFGIGSGLLAYTPTAEELDSVTILLENEENYFSSKVFEIQLKDEPTKTLVSKALSETVPMVKNDRINGIGGEIYGSYAPERYQMVKVCLQGDRGKQYRTLLISKEDYGFIVTTLEQHKEYKECFYQFPAPKAIGLEESTLTKTQEHELYEILMEDVKAMPFEQWHPMALSIDSYQGDRAFTVTVQAEEGGQDYLFYYPVTKTLMPQTFDYIMTNLIQNSESDIQFFKEELNSVVANQGLYEEYDVSVTILHPIEEVMSYGEYDWVTAMQEVLQYAKPYASGTDDVVVQMVLNQYNDNDYREIEVTFMVERQYIEPYLSSDYVEVYD